MTARYPTPPKNLMEFAHRFATDECCAEYLFELRHPDGYVGLDHNSAHPRQAASANGVR